MTMKIRPCAACPTCGATRVECRFTRDGYVLLRHFRPANGFSRSRSYCTAPPQIVDASTVLAWVEAERLSVADRVARYEAGVATAQRLLRETQAEAQEARAELEKIAEKARKVVSRG